ncbi:Tigger transposable element-derived protein 7 [Trichinella pseudospiralis]|uniref:Tigger transposable element-derived protein 7 n=1 Tax=Trichinella pseudospiralis TaxID=6337 RepID=A0A0V1EN19_TRIPS|nr:Tigger transposable element-derived protein 7 [Trichinella pseudospiralis]
MYKWEEERMHVKENREISKSTVEKLLRRSVIFDIVKFLASNEHSVRGDDESYSVSSSETCPLFGLFLRMFEFTLVRDTRLQEKEKALNLEQKLEVCRLVESGESFRRIAESFGDCLFTISDIYRSRRQLIDLISLMDIIVIRVAKRALGQPISGFILQEEALVFSTKLGIDDFVANSGWLRNFKSCHGLGELKIYGEKLSADS